MMVIFDSLAVILFKVISQVVPVGSVLYHFFGSGQISVLIISQLNLPVSSLPNGIGRFIVHDLGNVIVGINQNNIGLMILGINILHHHIIHNNPQHRLVVLYEQLHHLGTPRHYHARLRWYKFQISHHYYY